MDTAAVVSSLIANNQADIQPIMEQCGGFFPFMSLLPHVQAIVETANAHNADPADAVLNVVKHNEQSVREIFSKLGGLDGLIRLMPNLVNIYRTIAQAGHPLPTVLQHLVTIKELTP